MIKWIYAIAIVVMLLATIVAYWINRRKIKKLKCNNNFLKIFYGLAMWIAETFPSNLVLGNNHIQTSLRKLNIKDKVTKEQQEYVLEKLSIVLLVVMGTLGVGMITSFVYGDKGRIKTLERYEIGGGEAIYNLQATVEGEQKLLEICVPERIYSEEEANELLKESANQLEEIMLGENESAEQVTKSLNFVPTMMEGQVQVEWNISDDDIITYDGEIGNVDVDGNKVTVSANLLIQEYSMTKDFLITVFPIDPVQQLQEYVQKQVYSSDGSYKQIELPEKIAGKDIVFTLNSDNMHIWVFPVGMIIALAIFILKDKDLDKELEKRNQQLLSDYPEIVSKLLLLTMTGMSVRSAFVAILSSSGDKSNRYVYGEIRLMLANIQSGKSEYKAYEEFGKRCGIHCYIRLMNIVNQNLRRGSNEMGKVLKSELDAALLEKKNSALKLGETAGTKLLGPMIILLIISLVIVAAPALMSLKM